MPVPEALQLLIRAEYHKHKSRRLDSRKLVGKSWFALLRGRELADQG